MDGPVAPGRYRTRGGCGNAHAAAVECVGQPVTKLILGREESADDTPVRRCNLRGETSEQSERQGDERQRRHSISCRNLDATSILFFVMTCS